MHNFEMVSCRQASMVDATIKTELAKVVTLIPVLCRRMQLLHVLQISVQDGTIRGQLWQLDADRVVNQNESEAVSRLERPRLILKTTTLGYCLELVV